VVPPARLAAGVSVAVFELELYVTVPMTALPPLGVTVIELVVSVDGSTARENVAVTVVERAADDAPSAGDVELTVSGGGGAIVVNVHVTGAASAVPSAAVTDEANFAVYCVEYWSGAEGVIRAVVVELS
jgi:hypothetical protein